MVQKTLNIILVNEWYVPLSLLEFADGGRSFETPSGQIRHPYGPDVYFGSKAGLLIVS